MFMCLHTQFSKTLLSIWSHAKGSSQNGFMPLGYPFLIFYFFIVRIVLNIVISFEIWEKCDFI